MLKAGGGQCPHLGNRHPAQTHTALPLPTPPGPGRNLGIHILKRKRTPLFAKTGCKMQRTLVEGGGTTWEESSQGQAMGEQLTLLARKGTGSGARARTVALWEECGRGCVLKAKGGCCRNPFPLKSWRQARHVPEQPYSGKGHSRPCDLHLDRKEDVLIKIRVNDIVQQRGSDPSLPRDSSDRATGHPSPSPRPWPWSLGAL